MRLDVALLDSELRSRGLPLRSSRAPFRFPTVIVVEGFDDGSVAGRYFPSRNAILVVRHRDREVTQALIDHEHAHYEQYVARCGGVCSSHRRACGYVGQHDGRFYRALEEIHRKSGVSPRAARVVERQSGYDYPRTRWAGGEWPP